MPSRIFNNIKNKSACCIFDGEGFFDELHMSDFVVEDEIILGLKIVKIMSGGTGASISQGSDTYQSFNPIFINFKQTPLNIFNDFKSDDIIVASTNKTIMFEVEKQTTFTSEY